jgi:hypothetical protein
MAILNITYHGMSADVPIDIGTKITDADVRRIAVEMIRSGGVPGLHISNINANAFNNYVVDRFDTHQGGLRLYLRPKVPFGRGKR